MSQYLLAPHVYLCTTGDHVVLLDLKRDKYVGVGRSQLPALASCVKGWPSVEGPGDGVAKPASGTDSLAKMLAAGMLTTDEARGKEARPVSLPRPEASLATVDPRSDADPFGARPTIGAGRVLNFFHACFAARLALRLRSIASVVSRVAARKMRHAGAAQPIDLRAAREHVGAYVHLRPLLLTAKDACLFDSLVLVNYLARYGLFPTWVFGVQTGPFAAHSWVQYGDTVFNDTPEHVRRYTPILTV